MAALDTQVLVPSDAELRRYHQLVVGVVARRYRGLDRGDVEDCCQQAFLETWPKRAEYGDAYPNLLVTTALRRAHDVWRRYHARHALVDHAEHAAFAVAGDEPDPAAVALRDVELRRGAELLSMLPDHHQRIWRAYCDAGARHNVAAIAAIADAEGLSSRQVTKVIDKVKEKARRIAAASLTEDLEVDAAYCRRLADRISRHLSGHEPDAIAAAHLESCAHCRALFDRTRGVERAAAALLPPLPILHELGAFAATSAGSAGAGGAAAGLAAGAKAWIAAGVLAVGGGGTAVVVASRDAPPPAPARVAPASAPTAIAPPGSAAPPRTTKPRRTAQPSRSPQAPRSAQPSRSPQAPRSTQRPRSAQPSRSPQAPPATQPSRSPEPPRSAEPRATNEFGIE